MAILPAIDIDTRRARLVERHRLSAERRIDDVAQITDDLVALHSSDPASVYLSAMARMATPSIEAVSDALYEQRSVVRLHAMRRTIWVFTRSAAKSAHAACAVGIAATEWKQLTGWVERTGIAEPAAFLDRHGVDVLAALDRLGPVTARALGVKHPELTVKILAGSGSYAAEQSLHTRLLLNLGFDARIVRGRPMGSFLSSEYQWSRPQDWLGEPIAGEPITEARNDLVRRYLERCGPATTIDIRWWTGLPATAINAALRSIEAIEVALPAGESGAADGTGWVLPDDPVASETTTSVALLPGLDPSAMGWKERRWYLGDHGEFGVSLFDRNGNVGPTVWVDGEVVGGWAQRPDGSIVTELLNPVPGSRQRLIAEEADRLRASIGSARVTPRFPVPLQRRLESATA